MGGCVICRPRETEPKGMRAALRDGLVQLLLQIRNQSGLVRFQTSATRIACQCQRAVKLEVRQPADIVKVERISGIIWSGDVSVCPVRCLLQIVRRRVRTGWAAGAASLQSEIKFRGAQFQIIAPFRLWIKTERDHCQQISARRGVRQVEDVLGRRQALIRINRVAGLIFVIAEGKIGCQSSRQIRADQRVCDHLARRVHRCRTDKNRPMTNITIKRRTPAVRVIRLRQAPDVMIADGLPVAVADADLIIENFVIVVPHVL